MNGDENPLCTAALSELPGYSRVLYLCPGTARYITLQSPSAKALDVCTLSVYAQSAPHFQRRPSLQQACLHRDKR